MLLSSLRASLILVQPCPLLHSLLSLYREVKEGQEKKLHVNFMAFNKKLLK